MPSSSDKRSKKRSRRLSPLSSPHQQKDKPKHQPAFGNIDWGDLPPGHTDSVQKVMEDLQQLDQIRRGPAMNRATSFPTEQERKRQQRHQGKNLVPPSATPRSRSASFNLSDNKNHQHLHHSVPLEASSSLPSSSKGVLISTPPKQYRFGKSVRPPKSPSKQVSFQFPLKQTDPPSPPEPTRSASLNASFQPSADTSLLDKQSTADDTMEEMAGMETILLNDQVQPTPTQQNHPFDELSHVSSVEEASIAQITNRSTPASDSSKRWWVQPDFSTSKVTTIVNDPHSSRKNTPIKDNCSGGDMPAPSRKDLTPKALFRTPETDIASQGEDTSAMKVLGCASEFDETTTSSNSRGGPCKGWTRGERRLRRILAIATVVVLIFLGLAIFAFLRSREKSSNATGAAAKSPIDQVEDDPNGSSPTFSPTPAKKEAQTPAPTISMIERTASPTTQFMSRPPQASPTLSPTPRPSMPPTTSFPTEMPVVPPSEMSTIDRITSLILEISPESEDALQDPGSPQSRALTWIVVEQEQQQRRVLRRRSLAVASQRYSILQRWVMATLYYSLNGDLWNRKDRWLSNLDECTWFSTEPSGVCNEDGYIQSIDLQDNNLGGTLPPELSIFSGTLDRLFLNDNQIMGELPSSFGKLTKLGRLVLSRNEIGGSIPTEVAQMIELKTFSLGRNNLVGSIPSEIGGMSDLRIILLERNNLEAEIPSELGKLENLTLLQLNFNLLTGPIPSELGQLTALETFKIHRNDLTGAIPSPICMLTDVSGGGVLDPVSVDCDEISCAMNCCACFP